MTSTRSTKPGPRERLLATATRLFSTNGIRAVGIDRILREAGFSEVQLADDQQAYRALCQREFEEMRGPLKARMIEVLGREQQEHFLEDWRAMVVVCDSGEMRQGYVRARRPL